MAAAEEMSVDVAAAAVSRCRLGLARVSSYRANVTQSDWSA